MRSVIGPITHMFLEPTTAVADPEFAKGGTMASARSASLNGGLGAEPPAGSRGTPLVGDQGGEAPLKLKAFCTFLHKKVAKS